MQTPTVAFPDGNTGSTLLCAAMQSAVAGWPDVFAGVTVPEGGAFKRALPDVMVAFEGRRAASPERVAIARHLAAFLAERTTYGDGLLAIQLAAAPTDPVQLEEIAGTAAPGWVPRITWDGRVYEGAGVLDLVDHMCSTFQLTSFAADAIRWACRELLADGAIDLSGHRFALLGAAAELAPTPYLLEAGARVLWVDRQPPTDLDPSTFAGTVAHAPAARDLLTEVPAIHAIVAQEASVGPLHLGCYAYAPGRGRELLLTAAMNAIAAAVEPASASMLVSPTTPGEVQPSCQQDRATMRAATPGWQRALAAVGALREPSYLHHEGVEISRAIVPLQGPTYQAAQYLAKMMVAESWAVDRAPVRISANVAGITHTRSLEHPLFLAGFLGAPAFGIRVFEPDQTRVLTTLMLLHDLLNPEAPAVCAEAPTDRARAVVAQSIHGGVRSSPFVLDATIRVAALLGLGRRPSLLLRLARSA